MNVTIVEDGSEYQLPMYRVAEGFGLQPVEYCVFTIRFARGSRGGTCEPISGISREDLIEMLITDLEYNDSLVPSVETKQAISFLKNTRECLKNREINRLQRGVLTTNKL